MPHTTKGTLPELTNDLKAQIKAETTVEMTINGERKGMVYFNELALLVFAERIAAIAYAEGAAQERALHQPPLVPTAATRLSVQIEDYLEAPGHRYSEGLQLLRAAALCLRDKFATRAEVATRTPPPPEAQEPCSVCGNEEHTAAGYLSCECPAPPPEAQE